MKDPVIDASNIVKNVHNLMSTDAVDILVKIALACSGENNYESGRKTKEILIRERLIDA